MRTSLHGVLGLLAMSGAAEAQQAKFLDVIVTTDDGDSIVEKGESALICLYVQMTAPDDDELCGFASAIFDTVNEQNAETGEITQFGCLNNLCDFDVTTTDGVNLFNTTLGQLPVFGPFADSNPIGVYQFRWETDDYSQRIVKYRTITKAMQQWIGDCDSAIAVDAETIEADIVFCVDSCTPFDVTDQLWGLPHEGGGIEFGFDLQGNPGFDIVGAQGEVLVSLGDADGYEFGFDPLTMGAGSVLSVIPSTAFPGGPPMALWKHIYKVDDCTFHYFDTSPIAPESIQLVALLGGTPVHTFTCAGCNFDNEPAFVVAEAIGCWEIICLSDQSPFASLSFAAPSLVMLPDAEVMADSVEMHALNPQAPVSDLGLQALLAGEGFAHFTLMGESLSKFGFGHVSLDGALMQACSDCLVISNIGASGDDGVCVKHKPAEFVEVGFELNPIAGEQSFAVFESSVKSANNLKQIGLALHNYESNTWSLKPDFAAIADETHVVQCDVMHGESLIATIKGIVADPPQVFIVEPTDLSFVAELEEVESGERLGQQILSDSDFLVQDRFGNPIGKADHVHFSLADQVAEIDSIDSTSVRAALLQSLVITSEEVVPMQAGCFADCDGNGALNILDFVCYQNLFVSGNLAADCDGNGALNILDFVCYQNAFVAGCS